MERSRWFFKPNRPKPRTDRVQTSRQGKAEASQKTTVFTTRWQTSEIVVAGALFNVIARLMTSTTKPRL